MSGTFLNLNLLLLGNGAWCTRVENSEDSCPSIPYFEDFDVDIIDGLSERFNSSLIIEN